MFTVFCTVICDGTSDSDVIETKPDKKKTNMLGTKPFRRINIRKEKYEEN